MTGAAPSERKKQSRGWNYGPIRAVPEAPTQIPRLFGRGVKSIPEDRHGHSNGLLRESRIVQQIAWRPIGRRHRYLKAFSAEAGKRGAYFRKFRPERQLMKAVAFELDFSQPSCREVRFLRHFVLPNLWTKLQEFRDRQTLIDCDNQLLQWEGFYRFQRQGRSAKYPRRSKRIIGWLTDSFAAAAEKESKRRKARSRILARRCLLITID